MLLTAEAVTMLTTRANPMAQAKAIRIPAFKEPSAARMRSLCAVCATSLDEVPATVAA